MKELDGYVVSQHPRNKSLLRELQNAGINGVKINLALTNAQKLEELCLGKSLFGYEATSINWLPAEAVRRIGLKMRLPSAMSH